MNRSSEDIVAKATAQRATAVEMLQRAQQGESPVSGLGPDAAVHMLKENIASLDEMIRRHS